VTATLSQSPIVVASETWRGRMLVPVLIYVGLMVAIVSSLGAPLVPTIATDYSVSLGSAQWSLTITLLVGATLSPVVGRLGDGPRRLQVLLVALAVVVTGSVLAALPTNVFALLIAGRAMQGVGLALLPLAMSVARDHLEPSRAQSTMATLSVTALVGVGLGYPLTGLVAEHLSFHAGFWIAAALGIIAMTLVALVVPPSTHRPSQHFDLPGATLLGLVLAGLLVAISEAEDWGWLSGWLWGLIAASVVLLGIWIRHELRSHTPLVDLRIMRNPTVVTANVTGLIAGIGIYMMMSMIIRYVQTPTTISYGLGASVVVAGLVLLPMSALSFSSSKLVTFLGKWIPVARILPLGVLVLGVALTLLATSRGSLWEIFVIMGIGGIGVGISSAVMPRMIVGAVPAGQTSSALALNQVLRTIGYSIGSALAATILTAHTAAGQEFPSNRGYTVGSYVGLALCVIAAAACWSLSARRHPVVISTIALGPDADLEIEQDVDAAIAGIITLEAGEPDPPAKPFDQASG
jgi:MFS family permease